MCFAVGRWWGDSHRTVRGICIGAVKSKQFQLGDEVDSLRSFFFFARVHFFHVNGVKKAFFFWQPRQKIKAFNLLELRDGIHHPASLTSLVRFHQSAVLPHHQIIDMPVMSRFLLKRQRHRDRTKTCVM